MSITISGAATQQQLQQTHRKNAKSPFPADEDATSSLLATNVDATSSRDSGAAFLSQLDSMDGDDDEMQDPDDDRTYSEADFDVDANGSSIDGGLSSSSSDVMMALQRFASSKSD